jgi:hypothetical protein
MRVMRGAAQMIKQLLQLNQGRKTLHDWLGAGGIPVPLPEAQARADICLKCPFNYKGNWLWKVAVSMAISAQMMLRQAMNLRLEGEESLGVCELCGCMLKLKTHVPFRHIYRFTSDQQFTKYPDFCWQQKEYQQVKNENPSK